MITLRKGTSHEHLFQEWGLWWPMMDLDKRKAVFSCPGCGQVLSLCEWDIDPDGTVKPSVDHTRPDPQNGELRFPPYCRFHDCIRLEGWDL